MGPVQQVLTGLRGYVKCSAHLNTSSRITQSMCRTLSSDGREQSACVACRAPASTSMPNVPSGATCRANAAWTGPGALPRADPCVFPSAGDGRQRITDTALLPIAAGLNIPRLIAVPVLLSGAGSSPPGCIAGRRPCCASATGAAIAPTRAARPPARAVAVELDRHQSVLLVRQSPAGVFGVTGHSHCARRCC